MSQKKYYSNERNVQILISLLKAHGIKKGIISPGATNVCLVGSMQQDPYFELYSSVDERSAAYMACGLAAESGEPVFLSCTGATASRNYVPGLTEAFYRHLPVLAITSTQLRGRIGQDVPQVIDRSQQMKDLVNISVQAPMIHTSEDEWAVSLRINEAILALRHHGGGPAHINLETGYSKDFSIEKLPPAQVIKRLNVYDTFPQLPKGKIAVWVGNHNPFSEELTSLIDAFCAKYNAIVLGDHTSNFKGKYFINGHLSLNQDMWRESIFAHIDLLIHLGNVSGGYLGVSPKNVWRVNEDGRVCDPFHGLSYIFEMDEGAFFKYYVNQSCTLTKSDNFWKACEEEHQDLYKMIPELPFSNNWIAYNYSGTFPKGSILHLGILNSLRSWNFFDVPKSIKVFSNTGGFGIDGGVSSLVGASLANPDKLHFGVIGDLAFFYDMNVLGNRHVGRNVRLLLINNGLGTEFKNYNHAAAVFGDAGNSYMAAAGHFGKKSKALVKHYAEDLGFEYMSAENKEEFKLHSGRFFSEKEMDHPILFEVFTNSTDESNALKMLHSLKESKKDQAKQAIKGVLGESNVKRLKGLLGRR